jgi:hypothetical protein
MQGLISVPCSSSSMCSLWNRPIVNTKTLTQPTGPFPAKACRPPLLLYSLPAMLIGTFFLFPSPLLWPSAFLAYAWILLPLLPSRLPAASAMSRKPDQELVARAKAKGY